MAGHGLARQRKGIPVWARSCVQPVLEICHPEVAPLMIFVDQPDTARMAVAFLDERLGERAEKTFDVRLAHKQVERELNGAGLDFHEALRVATLRKLASQRGAQNFRVAGADFFRLSTLFVLCCASRAATPF
jgi:hypothetical protein